MKIVKQLTKKMEQMFQENLAFTKGALHCHTQNSLDDGFQTEVDLCKVVAGRYNVCTYSRQIIAGFGRNSVAGSGVFSVDNSNIYIILTFYQGQFTAQKFTARIGYNVTYK